MKISIKNFNDGGIIPRMFTCDGENVSPPLIVEGIPSEAKSLVLVIDDVSMPAGRINHWCLWNINPKTISMSKGSRPFGSVVGNNSFEKNYYMGPCPPENEEAHEYRIKLFALSSKLELPEKSTVDELENAMESKIIERTELVGFYGRTSPEIESALGVLGYRN